MHIDMGCTTIFSMRRPEDIINYITRANKIVHIYFKLPKPTVNIINCHFGNNIKILIKSNYSNDFFTLTSGLSRTNSLPVPHSGRARRKQGELI